MSRSRSRVAAPRSRKTTLEVSVLDERSLPAIVLPTPGISGGAFLTGSDLADQYVVRLAPGNASNIQFSDNGGASFSTAALADITGVFVQGPASSASATIPSRRNSDQLTIDHANGFVAKPGGLTIDFVGGQGKDYLVLSGNPGGGVNESYTQTVGSTSGGTIQAQSASALLTVTFQEVSRIRDSMVASSFTFTPDSGDNFIAIEKAKPLNGQNALRIEGVDFQGNSDELDLLYTEDNDNRVASRSVISFVPIDLNQKTAVTINAGAGNDLVVLDNKLSIPGLATLTVDGGSGTNRLYRDDSPAGATVTVTNFTVVAESASSETFITRLYVDRLKRLPSADDIASWKSALPNLGGAGVAALIDRSAEAYSRQVEDWYGRYLGRGSDDFGRAYWVGQVSGSMPEEQALSQVVSSTEYVSSSQSRFASGSSNQRFVQALYKDFLNRSPDDSGYSYWEHHLQQNPLSSAAFGFLTSPEFRSKFVETLYGETLTRDPDAGGLAYWVGSSFDDSSLRRGFRSSAEYYDDSRVGVAASAFDAAGRMTLQGGSLNRDDKKFYQFTAPRVGTLRVQVSLIAGSGSLEIEDSFGNTLAETEPNNGINSAAAPVAAGRTYFVRLRSGNASPFQFRADLSLT